MTNPGAAFGGWLREIEKETDVKVMQISIKTFHRLKIHNERFSNKNSGIVTYDDLITRLLDFYEKNK